MIVPIRFSHTDTSVVAVAALLSMDATPGTALAMNDMLAEGSINLHMTIGEIAFAYTQFQQRKLMARKD
jgi:hypothetical protein